MKDLLFAVKFPFTRTAKELISGEVTIDYDLIERSKKRLEDSIFGRRVTPAIVNDQKILFKELLSFPISKLIISQIDKKFKRQVIDSFVEAEANRSIEFLRNEKEYFELDAERLCKELGINRNGYNIEIFSYLRYAPNIETFYLENQDISNGYVILDREKFLSVLLEAIKKVIRPKTDVQIPNEIKKDIEEIANEINEKLQNYKKIKLESRKEVKTSIPPCMEKIIEKMLAGENTPHIARWVIGIYLIKSGRSIEEIMSLFSNLPNFNEKKTRYYLEYIKKKNYSVPSCANMESYGLCVSNCNVKNPMSYRKEKSKRER
jgi:DNA primase large subunit